MIQKERIKLLNNVPLQKNRYVLYWMQQSQREHYNHALEFSIEKANELKQPCVVFFGITDNYPNASERHYTFMLEGLLETQKALKARNIRMVIRHVSPEKGAVEMAIKASLAVTDRGYLDIQKNWRIYAAERMKCPLYQVEADVIVPVETASFKEDYSAGTFRPKFYRQAGNFIVSLSKRKVLKSSMGMRFDRIKSQSVPAILKQFKFDRSVPSGSSLSGGTAQALSHLEEFITDRATYYDNESNDPAKSIQSNLSPYLHFGQISPLYIYLEMMERVGPVAAGFLEQLAVRRELSMNFVHYNSEYNNLKCIPDWAMRSLLYHKGDKRPYIYSLKQLENAETHDPFWNAAQQEMTITGKMHGYMRMYWGKKILEWTRNPADAYSKAVLLNDKYSLDGRDANGYTGIAWCFGKHDRAWGERKIFGKVRYMNSKGLSRKFNMSEYLNRIENL
ncbi:MAG: deoxyribodipyrimidine photo-lyase [Fibrobacteria bacterium]|nr:deoxyribodipyrimidine photo-lyase [Fibrobacteria bacterium]